MELKQRREIKKMPYYLPGFQAGYGLFSGAEQYKGSDWVSPAGTTGFGIQSAIDSIGVQSENILSSLSTLRDADVAEESSNYLKAQILQQASATLLATANQQPAIALNLL